MQHNGYNYRTLNPWEQIALEHLSAIIGEIIGAGFENPNQLVERVGDTVLELSYWNTDPQPNTQQPKYIPYGISGKDGDQEINPAWEPKEDPDPEQDLSLERESENIPY